MPALETDGLLLSSSPQNQLCVYLIPSLYFHCPTLGHLTSLVNGSSFIRGPSHELGLSFLKTNSFPEGFFSLLLLGEHLTSLTDMSEHI